jgi:hypothetical protein
MYIYLARICSRQTRRQLLYKNKAVTKIDNTAESVRKDNIRHTPTSEFIVAVVFYMLCKVHLHLCIL